MDLSRRRPSGPPARGSGDGGTAILEFTLVAILLFMLVFGIINFGLILSFKQDVTRAAAEGARAGAIALPSTTTYGPNDPRRLAAQQATEEAVVGFDKQCGVDGMSCVVSIHDCDDPVPDTNGYHASDPSANDLNGFPNSQQDCVTVELDFDYEDHPIVVPVPLIAAFLPDHITAKSVARLNQ